MKASELTMVCPSRGRPGNIPQLTECWEQTGAQARLLVLVDDDDPEYDAYLRLPVEIEVIQEPRGIGPILNSVMPAIAQHGGAVGFLGDDHRPRTPGWDQALVDALPGVAYGNDLLQGANLPTAVAMSAGIVEVLGYFVPPGCMHLYLDDFWRQLGSGLGALTYLPDVIVEHMHPVAGKAPLDDGYVRVNAPHMYASDSMAYSQFLAHQWPGDLRRLLGSEWQ